MVHKTNDIYGPGTFVDSGFTPVPDECKRLLRLFASKTPGFTHDKSLLDGVVFEGNDLPCIPGPIKVQAVTAVLHAMVGIIGHEILKLRGISTNQVTYIDTNHAGLYPATPVLSSIDGYVGSNVNELDTVEEWGKGWQATPLLKRCGAIYPTATKDIWYQIHGSTNPWALLRALAIDPDTPCQSGDEAYDVIKNKTLEFQAGELEHMMVDYGFAGSIVYSPEGWLQTAVGKALAKHPLVNYSKQTQCPATPPTLCGSIQDKRPLAGIKVLELARIIAATAAGAALASMGAEVIRVNTDKLMDFTPATTSSLMAGKKAIKLDLDDPSDRAKLWDLVKECDVFLQAYRLRSLERRGFGLNALLEMASNRGRGIVYVDEHCYGPDGYYAERPGWQQTSDAAAGSSYIMGRAFGFPAGQGILPSLPISDMSTGILTCMTIMSALRDRARYGGSYHGNAALTAYNMSTLDSDVGLYQPEIVRQIQEKYGFDTWGSDAHVLPLYDAIAEAWGKNSSLIENEKYYSHFENGPFGKDHRVLAPVVRYEDPEMSPRWSSGPVPFCHHEFRHFASS